MWDAYEAADERRVDALVQEDRANADYRKWAENEGHVGNLPGSAERDRLIGWFSEQYPEVSSLEREQEEHYREAYGGGPRWEYPEYEGPGFTEPPVDWEGWHRDHKGWTFTEWALQHNYALERADEINRQFPPDPREIEYANRLAEQWEAEEERYYGDPEVWDYIGTPAPDPEPDPPPEAPGLLRIVTMEKGPDGVWQPPAHREIRGEPDPYDPLRFSQQG